jgi:hypothetical protein
MNGISSGPCQLTGFGVVAAMNLQNLLLYDYLLFDMRIERGFIWTPPVKRMGYPDLF